MRAMSVIDEVLAANEIYSRTRKLRTHPWIPESVAIRGFVYDVTSGRLREIKDA
jgi:carbonic anhydrase